MQKNKTGRSQFEIVNYKLFHFPACNRMNLYLSKLFLNRIQLYIVWLIYKCYGLFYQVYVEVSLIYFIVYLLKYLWSVDSLHVYTPLSSLPSPQPSFTLKIAPEATQGMNNPKLLSNRIIVSREDELPTI